MLARLREETSYCDFGKLKTATNPEEKLVKIRFISDFRESESKFRLLRGFKAKPAMSVTEMTKSLQFRSEAMFFASSSSHNKPFTVKEEVGFNFKKTFQKPNEKFRAHQSKNMCTRYGGMPHSSRPCPALRKKATTLKKLDTSQKCCDEEKIFSAQAPPASEMGIFLH